MTEEEMEKAIPEEYFGNFGEKVAEFKAKISMVEEAAKVYILRNWEKIGDWTGFCGTLVSGANSKSQYYYNYIEKPISESDSDVWKMWEQSLREDHYPLREVNEVVLDPTDGDFSVTVNGDEEFMWLEEGIIELASYIEKQLKDKKV
jgi:hypothetical protein